MTSEEQLGPLADYVDSELAYEWQRKTSLETRAFAAVTANLGFVTLFLALSANVEFGLDSGTAEVWIQIALGFVLLSIALAVLVAAPANYATPTLEALRSLYTRASSGDIVRQDLKSEIVEARIFQLGSARKSNKRKAVFSAASFASLGAAACCLSIAFTVAVTAR